LGIADYDTAAHYISNALG
jgi:type IV secretory pathway TraG/TraD family ATPase VirD4